MQFLNEIGADIDNLNTMISKADDYKAYTILLLAVICASIIIIIISLCREKSIFSISFILFMAGVGFLISYKIYRDTSSQIIPAAEEIMDNITNNENCSDIRITPDDKTVSISFTYNNTESDSKMPVNFVIRKLSTKDKTALMDYINNSAVNKNE